MPTGQFGTFPFGTHVFGPGAGTSTSVCPGPSIVSMVQTMLNESGAGVFWPVQQVYDAINEAQLEFEPIANLPIVQSTITFNPGEDLVPWPNTVLVWPQYLEFSGRKYWCVTHAELERYDRNWRSTTLAQPRFFVLWSETLLRPYPLADQTYVFNIWGPGWPQEINSTNTDFTAPNLMKLAIAFRACATLFQYTRPDLAEASLAEAEEYEARYRIQMRRQQSHNIKRLRPYNAMTHAQGGNVRIGKRLDGNNSNPYR